MGIHLTKKRKLILDALQENGGILSAKEVHQLVPNIDLVTVYRNLDLFAAEQLITKVSLSAGEVLYEYQPQSHHHAVCTTCGKIIHFTAADEKIKQLLNLKEFQIKEIDMTVHGTCKHT